jgi:hypothetical protein
MKYILIPYRIYLDLPLIQSPIDCNRQCTKSDVKYDLFYFFSLQLKTEFVKSISRMSSNVQKINFKASYLLSHEIHE